MSGGGPAAPPPGQRQREPVTPGGELLWWWNGSLTPESEVRLSPRDRGIRYGDGVYETIRIHRGRPFRLAEHLRRLQHGLGRLEIDLEAAGAFPGPAIEQLLAANVGPGEGRLRLTVTRGPDRGNHLPALTSRPTVLAVAEPLPPDAPLSAPRPRRLCVVEVPQRRPGVWSSLKSLSHLAYVLAASEARRRGADDGLLADGGRLLEATAANVFLVTAAGIRTPALAAGILAGVTRDLTIELARDRGLAVVEDRVQLDALAAAREVFLTGSVAGIQAVAAIDGQFAGQPAPGPVTVALAAAYAGCVEREIAQLQAPSRTIEREPDDRPS